MKNFKEPNGIPISNKETILQEINLSLHKDSDFNQSNPSNPSNQSNPSVEYLITKPYGFIRLPFGLGSFNFNWF